MLHTASPVGGNAQSSYAMTLHRERVARLARISAAATKRDVLPPDPAPVAPPAVAFKKEPWFYIVGVSADALLTMRQIKEAVCEHFGLEMVSMSTGRRNRAEVRPRQIAMYLCRELTSQSMPQIGRGFGGKDHSTIHHACGRIRSLLLADKKMSRDVAAIRAALEALQ
jgi:hypothetical protein